MGLEVTSFGFYNKCTAKFRYACLTSFGCFRKVPSPERITDLLLYHFQIHPKDLCQASGGSNEFTNVCKGLSKSGEQLVISFLATHLQEVNSLC